MGARVRQTIGNSYVRVTLLGALVGLLLFTVAMIWRGSRDETIVLDVLPAGDPSIVRVYVGGEVVAPGLYSLPRGSRVAEALAAAGGVTASGDTTRLGMAAPLEDADQIIVGARVPTSAALAPSPATTPAAERMAQPSGPLNINTADLAELEALPGIGPKLAERIVEYRQQHGPFQTIDELEAVAGISARMVEELRPLISVGP